MTLELKSNKISSDTTPTISTAHHRGSNIHTNRLIRCHSHQSLVRKFESWPKRRSKALHRLSDRGYYCGYQHYIAMP